ncbi:M48 family metalloprotease [Aquipuribacter sp. MA13-6]|uniref:M48 family metalloprotease n=1 Tax=unclassified Aquipuribacter TaxID=2635084 RepID=UPI003EEE88FB
MSRGGDEGGAAGRPLPPALAVVATAAVALLLTLVWLLVPWTSAPAGAVDPTAGLPGGVAETSAQVAASLRLPALLSLTVGLLTTALVVLSRPGRRLLARLPGRDGSSARVAGQVVVQVLAVLGLVLVARWPFGVWAEAVRRDAGLSVQGWGGWARDRLVSAGFEAVVLTVVVLTVVLLARVAPRWWPGVAAAVTATLVVVVSLLHPVVVEPALADLRPLADGPVRAQVERTAEQAGAPVADVLVSDASARTTALNAYVSGLGPTRRLVLQDTLLATMPPDQVRGVVAHETAHAAAQDVLRGTVLGAVGAGTVVLLLGSAAVVLGSRRGGRGVGGTSAAGVVLLAVLLVQVAAAPATALLSRQLERAADVRAVELTQDPAAYAEAMRTLLVTNRADPSPPAAYQWWFGTHPSGAERVARADATRWTTPPGTGVAGR